MEVDVENLAVAAPVAAKVEDDSFVLETGLFESRGDFGFRVGFGGVEVFFYRGHGGNRLACGGWRCRLVALATEDCSGGSEGEECDRGEERSAPVWGYRR